MEFEKYTDRAKGFIQSAQTLALRRGHQRLTPEHLLMVLLEDKEGLAANLIRAAQGDPKVAANAVEAELGKLPRVEGSGAGQVYLSPKSRAFSSRPSRSPRRLETVLSRLSDCCWLWRSPRKPQPVEPSPARA